MWRKGRHNLKSAVLATAAWLLAATAAQRMMICLCPHDADAGECHQRTGGHPVNDSGAALSAEHHHDCTDLQLAAADLLLPGVHHTITCAFAQANAHAAPADMRKLFSPGVMLPAATAPPPLPLIHAYARLQPRS